jgi:hypothetical protein
MGGTFHSDPQARLLCHCRHAGRAASWGRHSRGRARVRIDTTDPHSSFAGVELAGLRRKPLMKLGRENEGLASTWTGSYGHPSTFLGERRHAGSLKLFGSRDSCPSAAPYKRSASPRGPSSVVPVPRPGKVQPALTRPVLWRTAAVPCMPIVLTRTSQGSIERCAPRCPDHSAASIAPKSRSCAKRSPNYGHAWTGLAPHREMRRAADPRRQRSRYPLLSSRRGRWHYPAR